MNEYHKAYAILGLEPGSGQKAIQTRYKRLVMVWHPDRFPTEEGKKDAEEELKKINNAKDLLWKHFESGAHKATNCVCQPSSTANPEPPPPPRPKPHPHPQPQTGGSTGKNTKSAAEEEAARRDAQRKARAEQEAAEAKKRQEEQARNFASAQQQQSRFKEEQLRWKIAMAEAIVFAVLCVFGWIGSGIGSAIRNNTHNIHSDPTPVVEKKDDPCSLAGTYTTPPPRIEANMPYGAKGKISQWVVKCDGTAGGAIVEGRDTGNRLLLVQVYLQDWTVDHQDLLEPSANQITVNRYTTPNNFVGACVYTYDGGGHFLEVVKRDAQNNPVVSASVERTKFGKFYSLTVRPTGGNTTTYYDTSGFDVKDQFYMSPMLMNIEKFVEPPSALVSPDAAPTTQTTPAPSTQTDSGNGPSPWKINPDAIRPSSSFESPSGNKPSTTPYTDKLLEKLSK